MLGTCSSELPAIDLPTVRSGPSLSNSVREMLTQPISELEIDQALGSTDDTKAPGIDGFNSVFFKKSWSYINHDIYAAVQEFFQTSYMHNPVNITAMTLIPKKAELDMLRIFVL